MERHRHTQIGHLLISALGAPVVVLAAVLVVEGFALLLAAALALLVLCVVLFATLTVAVGSDTVRVSFGPGVITRTVTLADVESCRTVTNPWYYGWGIRKIPGGWMFNVSGLRAVELQMANGRTFRIGTDEPQKLYKAIEEALAELQV